MQLDAAIAEAKAFVEPKPKYAPPTFGERVAIRRVLRALEDYRSKVSEMSADLDRFALRAEEDKDPE